MRKPVVPSSDSNRPGNLGGQPEDKLPTYQQLLDESIDETFPASDPISPSAALNAGREVSTARDEKDWVLQPGSESALPADSHAARSGSAASADAGLASGTDAGSAAAIDRSPIKFPTSNDHPKTREERIREAAHRRFQARSGAAGNPEQDWLEAEAEVDGSDDGTG